jgi:hypothetical protein
MPGYRDDKETVLRRLRRIEGQVRGLQRMVEQVARNVPKHSTPTPAATSNAPPRGEDATVDMRSG